MKPYSVVLTSCGRFDLLDRTLKSLLPHLPISLCQKFLIIEDSGCREIFDVVEGFPIPIKVFFNSESIGQLASIDQAYSEINTEYIFHCEDDWEFISGQFIEDSFRILEIHSDVSYVGLRNLTDYRREPICHKVTLNCDFSYFLTDPPRDPTLFCYSFNPGLRRLSDYNRVAPFAGMWKGETDVARCFRLLGYKVAFLEHGVVRHLGDGRHVFDRTKENPQKRTTFWRLAHSLKKRVREIRRKFDPNIDPVNRVLTRDCEANGDMSLKSPSLRK